MEKNPLVTICLTTYNYGKFLEKSLQPLIHQSYSNFEIIVSDNQSTDNTKEIIELIQKKNPNIIYRENIKPAEFYDISAKNISDAENAKLYDVCFNHCNSCFNSGLIKGEFVIFCHQDDLYERDIVKEEAEFLIKNPEVAAVFTLGNIIDENDRIVGKFKLARELKNRNKYGFTEIFKAVLNNGNTFLITPTFMVRKEIFKEMGMFDDCGPFGGSGDLDMWLKISKKYPIGIIQKKLINWRKGGRATEYNQLRTEKADFFKVMDHYLLDKSCMEKVNRKDLRQYAFQKYFDETLIATNFLIKGQIKEVKAIVNKLPALNIVLAFLENINVRRIKILALRFILVIGVNLGLNKFLSKLLRKVI